MTISTGTRLMQLTLAVLAAIAAMTLAWHTLRGYAPSPTVSGPPGAHDGDANPLAEHKRAADAKKPRHLFSAIFDVATGDNTTALCSCELVLLGDNASILNTSAWLPRVAPSARAKRHAASSSAVASLKHPQPCRCQLNEVPVEHMGYTLACGPKCSCGMECHRSSEGHVRSSGQIKTTSCRSMAENGSRDRT